MNLTENRGGKSYASHALLAVSWQLIHNELCKCQSSEKYVGC